MKNKKFDKILCILFILINSNNLMSCTNSENSEHSDTRQTNYKMYKGINVSTWLSHTSALSGKETENYFTQKDLNKLAKIGFDHIRLPIAENMLYKSGLKKDENTFRLIHNLIGWCEEAGVTIALNFHIPRTDKKKIGLAESQNERDKIIAIWADLSNEFGKYPNELVAYEIYNEPNFQSDELWNAFANDIINCIRKKEAERIIILAPNGDNSIAKMQALQLPEDRKNIIISFHFYQPAILTHYGVGKLKDISVKLQYPGQIFPANEQDNKTPEEKNILKLFNGTFNLETQINRLMPAVEFAKNNNIRIRCGEYGCKDAYEKAFDDKDIKVRWFTDIVKAFDKLGIPHCLWGYKASFGIFDENTNIKDPRVVKAITGYSGE